ncbi:plasmid pRiA4b ORF-3 family protein [Thorsellia anophelis]|uniref:PRiA4b ORF-3-like protein n=1 Tax=Thorsellia anophelis DSM 18579 TaxID=1123402 RepID=A0A1I0B741_9GAMM|nr:plasmid pRiA4b ORF-3 family protein [Thorsellia anophelis]SET01970.1 pRiA4b ORF-3-like protein [Thorsellia anophelis DSM 18579]
MKFYVLNIQLVDIEPVIWRRLVVPSDITLDRLHDVIQISFELEDRHLFEFVIGDKRYTQQPESENEGLECGQYVLGDLVKRAKTKFKYFYDFGDGWEYELTLENSNYKVKPDEFYLCIQDGARSAPPEDVGGIPGYENFCHIMKNKKHPEYNDMIEWYGDEFDPEEFNLRWVQLHLYRYIRHSRHRFVDWCLS